MAKEALNLPPQNPNYEELTLGDLLRGIGEIAKTVLRFWWLVLLSIALFAALFWWQERQVPVTYRASLSFMLNEDSKASSGLNGILGAVGIAGGGPEYRLEKIVELRRSQLIVQNLLLDTVVVKGKKDRLGHHLIDVYGLRSAWQELGLQNWVDVRFIHDTIPALPLEQRQVLRNLYGITLSGTSDHPPLMRTAINPQTGILTLVTETVHEEFSAVLAEAGYARLSEFYIEKTTSGPRQTYNMLRARSDSIAGILNQVEYQLAAAEDVSTGVYRSIDQVQLNRLRRRENVLQLLYSEVTRNLAAAEFALGTTTPFFAVVDRPILPLSKRRGDPVLQALIGGALGAFLIIAALVGRHVVLAALNDGKDSAAQDRRT